MVTKVHTQSSILDGLLGDIISAIILRFTKLRVHPLENLWKSENRKLIGEPKDLSRIVKTMKPKVYEGTFIELELNGKKFLAFDMSRKPEEAKMSFPLDSDYKPYLNKKIRMTIEEKKITIERIEK